MSREAAGARPSERGEPDSGTADAGQLVSLAEALLALGDSHLAWRMLRVISPRELAADAELQARALALGSRLTLAHGAPAQTASDAPQSREPSRRNRGTARQQTCRTPLPL